MNGFQNILIPQSREDAKKIFEIISQRLSASAV
jgi:hypothetical protein